MATKKSTSSKTSKTKKNVESARKVVDSAYGDKMQENQGVALKYRIVTAALSIGLIVSLAFNIYLFRYMMNIVNIDYEMIQEYEYRYSSLKSDYEKLTNNNEEEVIED